MNLRSQAEIASTRVLYEIGSRIIREILYPLKGIIKRYTSELEVTDMIHLQQSIKKTVRNNYST